MVIRGREFYDPSVSGLLKPVIISHGFTADMSKSLDYAKVLAKAGYHAFIFDFCGGGYHTISDGSFHDYMTPLTEVDDLKCVIDYVCRLENIDRDALVLMGCSQGGFVSALAAAGLKEKVHGLILFYPALCIPDDARAGKMQTIRFDPNNIPVQIGVMPMVVSGSYAASVNRMNVFEEITGYTGHVLIVHGTADPIVSYGYSLVADEVYRKHDADCTLRLIQDAGHGFKDQYEDTAREILTEWISRI